MATQSHRHNHAAKPNSQGSPHASTKSAGPAPDLHGSAPQPRRSGARRRGRRCRGTPSSRGKPPGWPCQSSTRLQGCRPPREWRGSSPQPSYSSSRWRGTRPATGRIDAKSRTQGKRSPTRGTAPPRPSSVVRARRETKHERHAVRHHKRKRATRCAGQLGARV